MAKFKKIRKKGALYAIITQEFCSKDKSYKIKIESDERGLLKIKHSLISDDFICISKLFNNYELNKEDYDFIFNFITNLRFLQPIRNNYTEKEVNEFFN